MVRSNSPVSDFLVATAVNAAMRALTAVFHAVADGFRAIPPVATPDPLRDIRDRQEQAQRERARQQGLQAQQQQPPRQVGQGAALPQQAQLQQARNPPAPVMAPEPPPPDEPPPGDTPPV
jgi:hypothetical protein